MRGTISRTLIFKDVFVPKDSSLMPKGKYYEAAGELLSSADLPYGFIYICRRLETGYTCPVTYGGDEDTKEDPSPTTIKYINAVEWSRFGNFSKSQWSGKNWFN